NYTTSFSTTNSQLTVNPVALTTALDNVTVNKNYGTNDPALPALTSTTRLVTGTTLTHCNGASTTITYAATLASLQRNTAANAGNYAISTGTLALTGTLNCPTRRSSDLNYTTSFSTTNSQLTVNPVALTTALDNVTVNKNYGTNDPA